MDSSPIAPWLDEVGAGPTLADTLGSLPMPGGRLPAGKLLSGSSSSLAEARERFVLLGGFPELLLLDARRAGIGATDLASQVLVSQQTLRDDAVERAIYKDIPQSYDVRDAALLERLLYVLAGQVSGILAPRRICQELDGLTQPTFDKYLSYLEKTFLVFTLLNYSGREANIQKRGRKLYFVDGAVRNAALQRGLAVLDDPPEMGLLLENLVATTLRSLALYGGMRLFHWRDGRHEVDLVLDHPDRPIAVEVGSSPAHPLSGLQAFTERHPRFAGRCYLVAPQAPVLQPSDSSTMIGMLPLDLFLLACGRQAEAALVQRLPGS